MLNIVDLAGSEGRYIHNQKYIDEGLLSGRKGKSTSKNVKDYAKLRLDNLSPRSGSLLELGSIYTPSPTKINRNNKAGTNKKHGNSRQNSQIGSEYNQHGAQNTITHHSERGSQINTPMTGKRSTS